MIKKEKEEQLKSRMAALEIREEDLIEKFIMGSGSGGQKMNKTSSCVYLKHLISNIEVKCQQNRSRELNRYCARKELCDKLEGRLLGEKSKKQQEFEKIRRQKRKRSKRSKEKMLEGKRRRSETKEMRSSPES